MQDMLIEYKSTLKWLEKKRPDATEEDKEIIGAMISDLKFSIEWLTTGKRPGLRRGIERRAAYQREKPADPLTIQKYVRSTADEYNWTDIEEESCITEWDMNRLEDAMSVLTAREKEIYLMVRGYLFSYEEAARMLVVSKSTIQTCVERAEKKIAAQISQSLFSFAG